jgi:putative oxidoreductase
MTRRMMLLELMSALLIMLFLFASISKFLDFHRFIGDMNNQPLPNSWTPVLVWMILLLEIAISGAFIFEKTRLVGFYCSLIIMSLFTSYAIIILLHFFSYMPCSCGGVITKLSRKQLLLLNLFFVSISIAGILLKQQKGKSPFVLRQNNNN